MKSKQWYSKCKAVGIGLCLTLVGMAAQAQDAITLKVASYNVRYDNKGDRDAGNAWQNRLPVISSLIKYNDFDILGCQEVLAHQFEDLKQQLPQYTFIGVGRDDGKLAGEFAPIVFKSDRFSLLDSGVMWLSETPHTPSTGWDAALPRICTWARLQDTASGKRVWFFNLHLDHVGLKAREESCKLVLQRMRNVVGDDDVLWTGDFNVDQSNSIYQIIQGSDYVFDAYEQAAIRYAHNGTFNAFDPNLWTDSRIDHIFVSKDIQVNKYAVLLDTYRSAEDQEDVKKGDFPKELSFKNYKARLPSDHFPVVAEITIPIR
ncbi:MULTISPECIES: endonuclease/exonuclease/phosphatase family protein [Sphingobacterium]|uniref:Endonuclease/exonuclease/phosphatase family protein n=1 Tax=Sphingobacterium populi TaxID=1812824 RepID=A0ABW5UEB9_9SPHI|nr:endonuclease/exonuclease/phosphatase family protein [Sphingobacterium sp. CFCC 11742]